MPYLQVTQAEPGGPVEVWQVGGAVKKDAVLRFLGDTATKLFAAQAALEHVIATCDRCEGGEIETYPTGIEAFDGAGNPRVVDVPCPLCDPARKALALVKGEE